MGCQCELEVHFSLFICWLAEAQKFHLLWQNLHSSSHLCRALWMTPLRLVDVSTGGENGMVLKGPEANSYAVLAADCQLLSVRIGHNLLRSADTSTAAPRAAVTPSAYSSYQHVYTSVFSWKCNMALSYSHRYFHPLYSVWQNCVFDFVDTISNTRQPNLLSNPTAQISSL